MGIDIELLATAKLFARKTLSRRTVRQVESLNEMNPQTQTEVEVEEEVEGCPLEGAEGVIGIRRNPSQ